MLRGVDLSPKSSSLELFLNPAFDESWFSVAVIKYACVWGGKHE